MNVGLRTMATQRLRDWQFALDSDYSKDFSTAVLVWALEGIDLPSNTQLVERETDLTPPGTRRGVSDGDLINLGLSVTFTGDKPPGITGSKWVELVRVSERYGPDDLAEELFPARTKKDMAIRRTRIGDCIRCARRLQVDLSKLIFSIGVPDYIWVLNLCWAYLFAGENRDRWLRVLLASGSLSGDFAHYSTIAKLWNNKLKLVGFMEDGSDISLWAEAAGFVGYRNPPQPGFSQHVEAEKLAHGGEKDHSYPDSSLEALAQEVLEVEVEHSPYVSFSDFVEGGSWATAGSSSEGKVELDFAGEELTFKARKNLAYEVLDLRDLADRARNNKKQINISIVKSELGKLRIAVAGDLLTYLQMTWINERLNGCYLKWRGSTIEEGNHEQFARMVQMLKALKGRYGLPYDYAAFDHQPTTDELLVILDRVLDLARRNVPTEHHSEFDEIGENVRVGFGHSVLITREEGHTWSVPVTGGLMSGLRMTTLVGNAWNTLMTERVLRILTMLGLPTERIDRWIRGDDSALICDSWSECLSVSMGYQAIHVEGGLGKFGIHYEQSEFLRVWYNATSGCKGYWSRAVSGLAQRKPWTSEPWSEVGTMKSLFETIITLTRRGCDETVGQVVWAELARTWSRKTRLPSCGLSAPTAVGGYGVGWWDGRTVPSRPMPKVQSGSLLEVKNLTEWGEARVKADFAAFNLSGDEAKSIRKERVAAAITGDDVPDVSKRLRDMWRSEVKSWTRKERPSQKLAMAGISAPGPMYRVLGLGPQTLAELEDDYLSKCGPAFGVGRADLGDFIRAKELSVLRKWTGPSWLRDNRPSTWGWVRWLEGKGFHRAEALDWVFGVVPGLGASLHPALTKLHARGVGSLVWAEVSNRLRSGHIVQLVAEAARVSNSWLKTSALFQMVFRW